MLPHFCSPFLLLFPPKIGYYKSMNSSLPPLPVSDPSHSPIQVISSSRTSKKKIAYIVASILVSLAGIISAVYFIGYKQFFGTQACDCNKYQFHVSRTGEVTVTNNDPNTISSQKVSISINGSPVAVLDVPSVTYGNTVNLGTVNVPLDGVFTWDAVGTRVCSDHGSYTSTHPTPTPTPETVPSPTPTRPPGCTPTVCQRTPTPPRPTNTPAPTHTPSPTPDVTSTPGPTPTNTPIPSPTPTTPPGHPTSTPNPNPTATPNPTNPPVIPNSCGGTCGSDSNCAADLTCHDGFCRRPACPDSESCACAPPPGPYNSPTPTPPTQLAQTGAVENTFFLAAGSFLLIGLGILLAF